MAIWTSRYSNKELVENKNKYYCVGISLGTPKFPLGYIIEQQCYSLAPKGYMLRMELEKFTEEYYRKLEGIGSDRIIDMVMRFEKTAADEGKELVLLCYEDVRIPEDWCHRTVFAQWYCGNSAGRILLFGGAGNAGTGNDRIKITGLGIWKIILEGELTNGRKEGMVRSTKIYWRKCPGECSCKSNEERSSVCETGNHPGITHVWSSFQERWK